MTNHLTFEHRCIDAHPAGSENDVCLIGDISGNGLNDIVIGGKHGADNLVWYENPSWRRHTIGTAHLEAGGVLVDVNGNGRLDLVVGNPLDGHPNTELYWYQCPPDPRSLWTRHVITAQFVKYHDQAAGDVDGDGRPEIVFASQRSQVVGYYDIPADPTISPWPDSHLHVIAEGLSVEGLCIVDIDGDGENEVIAGPNIFKRVPKGAWKRTELGLDLRQTRVVVADLDGDGALEIVVAEGESDQGRVAWFKGPDWKMRLLDAGFFHPHSLDVADVTGNGRPDIFVGEMGLRSYPDPREVIYCNLGGGQFKMQVVGNLATHDAKLGDVTGNGVPDIVGKPYSPGNQVDIWVNLTRAAQDSE